MSTTRTERDFPHEEAVLPPTWAESRRFVPRAFVQPMLRFMRAEASSGALMLLAATLALVWANSAWSESYFGLFEARIHITVGDIELHHLSDLTVREWINDALMAIFFFVVGLEIKRELVIGDLRDPRAAALPAVAALGGMVVPALIYLGLNAGTDASGGWGVPMATDIAFAAGIAALMGRRVPIQAKLFLLALAIVDDLGAILVIAIFYTSELSFAWLAVAGAGLVLVYGMRRVAVRHLLVYGVLGVVVWTALQQSGVHATIAGVALALMTPVGAFYDPRKFAGRAERLVDRASRLLPEDRKLLYSDRHMLERVQAITTDVQRLARESIPPLNRLEHALSPWASFVIVPLFALANAGVRIDADALGSMFDDAVFLGVALGLVLGKVVGISLFSWLAVKARIARLPPKTMWKHVIGVGFLGGIGFTVALFVASLAFEPGSAAADRAKLGIFAASVAAGLLAWVWLRIFCPPAEAVSRDHDAVPDAYQR